MSDTEYILRIALSLGLIWFILFFLILMHEYGHAIAAKAVDLDVKKLVVGWPVIYKNNVRGLEYEIGAIPVFGYVLVPSLPKASFPDKAIFAIAGPAASAVLGVLLISMSDGQGLDLFKIAGHSSLTLAVVSLIPLPPLDGWPVAQYVAYKMGFTPPESSLKLTFAGIASIALTVVIVWQYGGL